MRDWLKTALDSTNARQNTKGGVGDQSAAMTLQGDLARRYIPLAQKLLGALANFMQLGGVTYGIRTITLPDGAKIQVIRNYALNTIRIFAPGTTTATVVFERLVGGFIFLPNDWQTTWQSTFLRTLFKNSDPQPYPAQTLKTLLKAKPITWTRKLIDPDSGTFQELIISWDHGLPCRYRLSTGEDMECGGRFLGLDQAGEPIFANNGEKNLYVSGVEIETTYSVVGAGAKDDWLLYVAYVDLSWVSDPSLSETANLINQHNANAKRATFFRGKGVLGNEWDWEVVGYVEAETSTFKSPWFFNIDGTHAATVLEPFSGNTGTCHIYEVTFIPYGDDQLTLALSTESRDYGVPLAVLPYTAETSTDTMLGSVEVGPWLASREVDTSIVYPLESLSSIPQIVADNANQLVADEIARCPTKVPPPSLNTYNAVTDPVGMVAAISALPDQAWNNSGGYFEWFAANLVRIMDRATFYVTGVTNDEAAIIFDDFVNDQCAPIEGVLGFKSYLVQRETRSTNDATTTTYLYQTEINGGRLVAVDYGFDNQRLLVEQILTVEKADYQFSETADKEYIHCTTGQRSVWDDSLGPRSYIGWEYEYLSEWDIDMRWEFLVNGKPLVTATGQLTPTNGSGSTYSRKNIFRTDLSNNIFVNDYAYEIGEAAIKTECVWLLDADARTESVIYNHEIATAVTETPEEIYGDNINFHWHAHTILVNVGLKSGSHEKKSYIVAVHQGEEVARKEVPSRDPYGILSLYERGAALQLIPRMFRLNDAFETFIPDIFAWDWDREFYNPDPASYRTWMVTPLDAQPTQRLDGSLTVRTSDEAMFSASDLSIIGVESVFGYQQRDPQHAYAALLDNEPGYDVLSEFLKAVALFNDSLPSDSDDIIPETADDGFNLLNIRAF
jgi:hypothetical protein